MELGIGLRRMTVDLATATPTRIPAGYRLAFPASGNPAGARLTMRGDGVNVDVLTPGSVVDCKFVDASLVREADSSTAGTAVVYVSMDPDVWLVSPAAGDASLAAPPGTAVGPSGASTQASTSAANTPVAATDGVSAAGLRAVKVGVSAPAAQTINAAGATSELRFWWYDGAAARWFLSEQGVVLGRSGVRDIMTGDVPVAVPVDADRFYVEALQIVSSGAGALTVTVKASYAR